MYLFVVRSFQGSEELVNSILNIHILYVALLVRLVYSTLVNNLKRIRR